MKKLFCLLISFMVSFSVIQSQITELKRVDSAMGSLKYSQSQQAYFATLYTAMQKEICNELNEGKFTDSNLISHIQYNFGRYYLSALTGFQSGDNIPYCWRLALDTSQCKDFSYVQLLALGTNAHINHDLYFILLDYFKTHGIKGHDAAKAQKQFMAISNRETDRTIKNFIKTDKEIGRWHSYLIWQGRRRVKRQMKSSLKTTWKNAIQAAQYPEKEAEITKRQLVYINKTALSFIHPKFPMKQGFKILSSLDDLSFATKIEMLEYGVKK